MGTVNYEWGKLGTEYFKRLKKEREQRTLRISTRLLAKIHKDRSATKSDEPAK
jgi:hypothetical protein